MDDHIGLLDGKVSKPKPFSRRFTFITYFCVSAIIIYVLITIEWQNIGQRISLFSESRLNSIIDERIIKILNSREFAQDHRILSNKSIISSKLTLLEKVTTEKPYLPEKSYRINTPNCKISSLPLFDLETKHLFKYINKTERIWKCSHKQLVKVNRFNETSLQLIWNNVGYKPFCYYRKLSRGKDDFTYDYGEFIGPIVSDLHLYDYNFVHIVCYKNSITNINEFKFNSTSPQLIHNEIIPLIPFVNKSSTSSVPNILLLAIDATSYVNFKRHFIKTEKLLNKHKFFELRGYNKVGHNTYPNMIPFFTGHNSNEIAPDDKLHDIYFDDWPLIWKKFSKKGFITTYLEEMSWCGLFHYNLWGFKNQPTDYQLRPFHMQIRDEKYNYYCYLNRTETENCLEWTYDYVKAMNKRKQKYFAYISISEMTHDWIEAGHYMDVPYHSLLTKLFDENLLKDTLLIFFSDHGFRYGSLRQTHTGEVENRLPFIFIHLPENFNTKYTENLRQNQFRLTTPFDIHATLTHLIEGHPNHSLPHGLSLFEDVIPDTRNCNTSSIPEMYCSCYDDIQITDFDIIKPKETVVKIVKKLISFTESVRSKCAEYVFHSIHKLFERSISRTDTEFKLGDSKIFIIQFYVNPGMALFETVIRGFDKNTKFEVIGQITRINLYGNQPHCINDKLLNAYCFCNDLL